jgi:hypothetical protein
MELFFVISLFATVSIMIAVVVDELAQKFVQERRDQLLTIQAQMPDCEPLPRDRVPHEFENEKLPYDEAA